MALHAIEGAGIFRGFRHTGNYRREGFVVEANFREETYLRIDFYYIRESFDFFAGIFIQYADRIARLRFTLWPACSTKNVFGASPEWCRTTHSARADWKRVPDGPRPVKA